MQAIILAAGCGSRLKQSNKGNPKALIKLDQAHLIEVRYSSVGQYLRISA